MSKPIEMRFDDQRYDISQRYQPNSHNVDSRATEESVLIKRNKPFRHQPQPNGLTGHDEDTSLRREFYVHENKYTLLIVRPRQRSFMKMLGRSSPIREFATNLDCIGLCAAGNSAFDEEVELMHSKYERRANGEHQPLEVRLERTHKLVAEEKLRHTPNEVLYPQLRDDGHVTQQIGIDVDRD